jgi:hypothetical protein
MKLAFMHESDVSLCLIVCNQIPAPNGEACVWGQVRYPHLGFVGSGAVGVGQPVSHHGYYGQQAIVTTT